MSRIKQTFETLKKQMRKGLIPFITVGDPSLAATLQLMHALVEGGADVIELGVPFSDPMADGPVIQRASERALKNKVGLADVFECVRNFRTTNATTPVVLMGYANPIEHMGIGAFVEQAAKAGVDGVLVVDYPPEECTDFAASMKAHGLDVIFLLAPTSTQERIQHVANHASGYVYYVSLKGVTGHKEIDLNDVRQKLATITQQVNLPIAVGFGIRDEKTAKLISELADGVVIGSRIIEDIEANNQKNTSITEIASSVKSLLTRMRNAIDKE